jgi:hypothetical protein
VSAFVTVDAVVVAGVRARTPAAAVVVRETAETVVRSANALRELLVVAGDPGDVVPVALL